MLPFGERNSRPSHRQVPRPWRPAGSCALGSVRSSQHRHGSPCVPSALRAIPPPRRGRHRVAPRDRSPPVRPGRQVTTIVVNRRSAPLWRSPEMPWATALSVTASRPVVGSRMTSTGAFRNRARARVTPRWPPDRPAPGSVTPCLSPSRCTSTTSTSHRRAQRGVDRLWRPRGVPPVRFERSHPVKRSVRWGSTSSDRRASTRPRPSTCDAPYRAVAAVLVGMPTVLTGP